jgi:PelA/Pel-15E family pectate lyase
MINFESIKKRNVLLFVMLFSSFIGIIHAERFSWDRYEQKSNDWFNSGEAKRVAENILSYQDQYGSWPKNIDTAAELFSADRKDLHGTFDNGATTGEMRFLARIYQAAKEPAYKEAFIKGLDLILKAQYPTGGWPQHYPPGEGYKRHITFNDGAMVRLMELLREIANSSDYDFVDADRRTAAQKAFNHGIDCILKCQIRVDGKLKIWCAQHDEIDYSPQPARSYELISLSGGESAGILRLLMSLENPSQQIIKAITAGVKWYRGSAVEGIRLQWIDGKLRVVEDSEAPPVWGRFYEIETNRPFFCDRDGIPKYDYNQIDQERSTGYKWYGDWGQDVFRDYEKWSKRWAHLLLSEGTKVLIIVGDSTVCNWPEDDVRRGWGQFVQDYFTDNFKVINKARSGRSTKTFIQQGLWKEILDLKPDYVLIQFGHNDSHAPERPEATDANMDYQDYLRQYIEESRQIGAIPVLVTPMYRRKFDEQGNIHDNLLPYANAMKQVAKEKNVPLVDLNAASEKLYLQLGPQKVIELANAPDDQTHFNEKGARQMVRLVMEQLPQVAPSLKAYLKKEQSNSNQITYQSLPPIEAPFEMPILKIPVFPDRSYDIRDYGAKEGGDVKITQAIKKAIADCHNAGGGSVVIPKGKWLTGAVHLKSNVNFHVVEGAELHFSDDPADYLPTVHTTWEGLECYNYSPLIYAYQCQNIAITGKGKLICNQYKWRRWMTRPPAHMQGLKELYEMAAKNVPVRQRQMVRDNINLRPQFIQPNRCKNVLIENVIIRNSPFWTVHPVLCENVIIRGIDVKCRGRNTDGVDPEFCKNVLIEHCRFDQGDDPIVIKAGRNQDAWRIGKSSENIVIRYCTVVLGHNLLAIGSEMSGGVRNVYMHDCGYQPYEGFVRSCVLIKTNHRRGGFVENIYVDNIKFNGTKPGKALLEIDTDVLYQWRNLVPTYEKRLTKIGNIQLKNITVDRSEYGIWIHGDDEEPVGEIILENAKVNEILKKPREVINTENIIEKNVQFGVE